MRRRVQIAITVLEEVSNEIRRVKEITGLSIGDIVMLKWKGYRIVKVDPVTKHEEVIFE